MIPLDHAKQVVRRILFVCKNEAAATLAVCRFPIEPPADIGGTALLTPLEYEGPDPASPRPLLFQTLLYGKAGPGSM